MKQRSSRKTGTSRRRVLKSAVAAAAGAGAARALAADEPSPTRALDGRLKQSIIHWCFKEHWDVEQTARVAKELGCRSVEIVDPEHWPTLKKYGLTCAIAGSHGFVKGMNNPKHWPECIDILTKRIDASADAGVGNVITFTGMRDGMADDVGAKNCVEGYKKIIGYAEKKKVTLCLETLNSRVDVTMKGHPGYQGDHTDYCIDIIKRVGSARLKLLFDVYHVQIMDGDVITRIRQYKDYIGHVHTAGVPGRAELDDRQEINYRGVMLALADAGFGGFVGQEFIPTRDPKEGLRQAVEVCTV
jgi:hydroxypyruvate isomerase